MHFTVFANSCRSDLSANKLSPKISRLSLWSILDIRFCAQYERSGSSSNTLGSSFGLTSFLKERATVTEPKTKLLQARRSRSRLTFPTTIVTSLYPKNDSSELASKPTCWTIFIGFIVVAFFVSSFIGTSMMIINTRLNSTVLGQLSNSRQFDDQRQLFQSLTHAKGFIHQSTSRLGKSTPADAAEMG